MAWEWSHTDEAYAAAELNLRALDYFTLRQIWAEWKASTPDENYNYDLDVPEYHKWLTISDGKPSDTLADDIWQWSSELATCDNGGHSAWMCPHGCGPHTVSFDR